MYSCITIFLIIFLEILGAVSFVLSFLRYPSELCNIVLRAENESELKTLIRPVMMTSDKAVLLLVSRNTMSDCNFKAELSALLKDFPKLSAKVTD